MSTPSQSNYSWSAKWLTPVGRRWLWTLLFEKWLRWLPYPNWRGTFLRLIGVRVGEQSFIHEVFFQNPYGSGFKNLEVGNQVGVQSQCLIDLADKVVIEDQVTVSAGVTILTHSDCGAKMNKPLAEYFPPTKAPVHLKKGCWIGTQATLMPGVTVGECSVVGAGSLVREDVPPWTVVAGSPAKIIRTVKEESQRVSCESK